LELLTSAKQAESEEGVFLTNSLKLEIAKPKRATLSFACSWAIAFANGANRQLTRQRGSEAGCICHAKAHQALVAYLTSDRSPKNLSELLARCPIVC